MPGATPHYFPLRLGQRQRIRHPVWKPIQQENPDILKKLYGNSRRGIKDLAAQGIVSMEESSVLTDIQRGALEGGYHVILGAPGAGKTTLLQQWWRRWMSELDPNWGCMLPVYVKLRWIVDHRGLANKDALMQALWEEGRQLISKLPPGVGQTWYRKTQHRYHHVCWLLDGLDELPDSFRSERFFAWLGDLPGTVIITCRVAVHAILDHLFSDWERSQYTVLPLNDKEQRQFLRTAMDLGHKADTLHRRIRGHRQLSPLAGNPFLLTLFADFMDDLPRDRATFYERAIQASWHRKLVDKPHLRQTDVYRDPLLERMAVDSSLQHFHGSFIELRRRAMDIAGPEHSTELIDALSRSGVIQIDERFDRFEFPHLTFEEYYLARAWAHQSFQAILDQYWHVTRFEQALALLIAMKVGRGGEDEITDSMHALIAWGRETFLRIPSTLFVLKQSPLRAVLHLCALALMDLRKMPRLAQLLRCEVMLSNARALAVATDPLTPTHLLAELAASDEPNVKDAAAENLPPKQDTASDDSSDVSAQYQDCSERPEDALKSAASKVEEIRIMIAHLKQTPAHLLRPLAEDLSSYVRAGVAANVSTAPDTLAKLAKDLHENVRCAVASNPVAPRQVLASLACEAACWGYIVSNPAASPETLEYLSRRVCQRMLRELAANKSASHETLDRIAREGDKELQLRVAANTGTSENTLDYLANEGSYAICWHIAANRSASARTLGLLAQSNDADIQRTLAYNPNTILECLIDEKSK